MVELMIGIGIFGVLLAVSLPAFGSFLQTWKLSGESSKLASTLRQARSAAITKNVEAVFDFSEDAGTYFYFEDDNGDGAHGAGEYQSATTPFSHGIFFDSNTLSETKITFGPRGNANETGTITLINSYQATRTISIFGGTGNISVD